MRCLLTLLVLLNFVSFSTTDLCHKCASANAIWNWVKYGLPVYQGDSMTSDDRCLTETQLKKDSDSCNGLCSTINITRSGGEEKPGKTIAIVRDCYRGKKLIELAAGDGPICEWYEKRVNQRNVNITTCYCKGRFCNGIGSSKAINENSKTLNRTTFETPQEEASSFPWFIVHLSIISFLY